MLSKDIRGVKTVTYENVKWGFNYQIGRDISALCIRKMPNETLVYAVTLSPSPPSDGTGRGAVPAPTGAGSGLARRSSQKTEEKVKTLGDSGQPLPCGSKLPAVVVLFLPRRCLGRSSVPNI